MLGHVLGTKTLVARHGLGLERHVLFVIGDAFIHFGGNLVLFAVAVVVRVASAPLEVVVS